jgi:hypothetical protein
MLTRFTIALAGCALTRQAHADPTFTKDEATHIVAHARAALASRPGWRNFVSLLGKY